LPSSPLLPYTTLFRSQLRSALSNMNPGPAPGFCYLHGTFFGYIMVSIQSQQTGESHEQPPAWLRHCLQREQLPPETCPLRPRCRSEEHTSELQSRENL